jgi:hypothetical protein
MCKKFFNFQIKKKLYIHAYFSSCLTWPTRKQNKNSFCLSIAEKVYGEKFSHTNKFRTVRNNFFFATTTDSEYIT